MDVSYLIVSWNVRDLLRCAIRAVLADSASAESEILVVDNSSRDGTVEMLRQEFPDVRLVANTTNLGFTAANNQALARARGRYFFLLNPDTELVPGATTALLRYMEENPRIGIAGPQLLNPDGTIQSSRRRFPDIGTALIESTRMQQLYASNRRLARYYLSDTDDDAIQDVDWVVGAAMFVRGEVYEQIGGMDEGYFMYSEEMDWCRRAKSAGWRIVYFPPAKLLHYEGKSSEQVAAARDIYFHSSKVRFFQKHHGKFQAEVLRLFLLGMFTCQLIEEGAKGLVGHKRSLRWARVQAYWQVLRSGLK